MFEQFIERENTIFDILQDFMNNKLEFVLVGGYAVSSFKHRFSVDADIVVKSEDIKKFESVLLRKKFKKTISKELENFYSTRFFRFENIGELRVSVDLMIDGMGIRQTNSALSFEMIMNNSIKRKVKGIEKEVEVRVPSKELLIAMKLQAGRLTDFRDIVALSKDIDIEKIKIFLKNSDRLVIKNNIDSLLSLIEKIAFIDSFKGVFIEKKFDIDLHAVKKLKEIIK